MADGSIRINTKIDNTGIKTGMKEIESIVNSSSSKAVKGLDVISSGLKKIATLALTAFSVTAIGNFSKECVDEAGKLQASLIGLQSIVEGQGRSFNKAKGFVDNYIKDGLIPMNEAVTAYKNLAMRGYNDDQIQGTLTKLKDAASFGRQASLTMGQAVSSATEGLKNENSILVDNAGVTKNVSIMWKEYAKSIGTTMDKLTTQQKIQAEVNGILTETRFQTGDAAKYAKTYQGQVSNLSASFLQLKQNIGALMQGLFGSVINGIGKAVSALNVFVQAIGRVIEMFTGTNPLKQFNSDIKDTETSINNVNSGLGGIGDIADKSNNKIKKLKKELAGFDSVYKLSAPDQDTSGSGSTGGVSGGGNIGSIGDMSNGLFDDASSKIESLAKKMKNFLDTTIKTLKKYEPLIKGIGAAFLTAFGFKWIVSALSKFSKLSAIAGIIMAIKQALAVAIVTFGLSHNPILALAAGFGSLWASLMKFLGGLTPMQKFGATLVSLVAIFVTTESAIKNFNLGTANLGDVLMNIVPIAGVVGVALYGMLGPIGLVLEAVTLLIAGFVGMNAAQEEVQKQLNNTIMFENTGAKIDTVTEKLKNNNKEILSSANRINEWGNTIEDNNKKIDDNIATIGYYGDKIIYGGNITQEETQKMITAFQDVRNSVKENFELSTRGILETFRTTLSGVATDVGIDMKTISGHVFEFQNLFGEKTTALEKDISSLEEQIMRSGPTPELLQKYGDLQQQYVELNSEVPIATTRFQEQIKAFNDGKINFEDTETAKTKLQELGGTFTELMTGIGENKEQTLNQFDNLIRQVPLLVSDPIKQQELITAFEGYKETARKGFELKEEDIKTQFYGQVQNIQKNFNENLEKIASETVPTFSQKWDTGWQSWDGAEWDKKLAIRIRNDVANLNKPIQDEIDSLMKNTAPKAKQLGENVPVSIGQGINEKSSLPGTEIEKIISGLQTHAGNKNLIRDYIATGNNIDEGLAKGLRDKMNLPADEANRLGNEIINQTRKALDSHSPSREMVTVGKDTDQGLANGIRDNKNIVLEQARILISEMESLFKNMNLSFNVNFPDVRNSMNAFIDRFENMINRITNSMNNWLYNMTSSMNNLRVSGDGKVTYSGISRVYIPRFARGAIVNRPTQAIIGDAGKEAVLPLQNNTSWMNDLADKIASKISVSGNDGTIILNNIMDSEVISKKVIEIQDRNRLLTNGGW